MKIKDVRVIGRELPFPQTALVEVESDDGLVGIGATATPAVVVSAMVEQGETSLKPMLLGKDPSDPRELWRVMFEDWQAMRGRGGEGGVGVNAMGAVDMAIWDLAGKAAGKPVHQLLGGAVKERIMVYASATYSDETQPVVDGRWARKQLKGLVEENRAYVDQGFKAIKFGWGNNYEPDDMEKLHAVRREVGPDVKLMLDFGCPAYLEKGWSVDKAIALAEKLAPLNLFFLEEALHPYDAEGFAMLRRESPIPIATGESLVTLTDFDHFIRPNAVDVLQADAQQTGVSVFNEVAGRVEAAGMLTIPHCPWTAMAIGAHLQVLSTYESSILIEYPAMAGFIEGDRRWRTTDFFNYRVVETPPALVDGHIELTDAPGLGLGQFDRKAMAEMARQADSA